MYGSKCWVVDNRIEPNMNVLEISMLRRTRRVMRKDRTRNEYIRDSFVVVK